MRDNVYMSMLYLKHFSYLLVFSFITLYYILSILFFVLKQTVGTTGISYLLR